MLKVTNLRAHAVSVPLPAMFFVGTSSFSTATVVVVEAETDQGITGLATLHGRGMKTVVAMIEALNDLLRGMDAMAHEAVWAKVFGLTTAKADPNAPRPPAIFGPDNRAQLMTALAGIDICLWDIKGKALNQPVWRLLGAARTTMPAYVTGGYYRSDRPEGGMRAEMQSYLDQGYTAVKIKVGASTLAADLKRIAEVRDTIGPNGQIMLDGNNAYSLAEAEAAIKAFEPFNPAWFEEPIHWYDSCRALGKLAARTHVPIASGESEIHAWACRDLVDLGGVRVMQFDACRSGGITEWLRVAAYCHLHGVAMSTHHEPHIHGHLAAAAPNGLNVECFPDADRDPIFANMYTERAVLKDGHLHLNDKPGLGFALDWDYVRRYAG